MMGGKAVGDRRVSGARVILYTSKALTFCTGQLFEGQAGIPSQGVVHALLLD